MTDQQIIDLINTSLEEEFELEEDDMKPEALLFEDLELDSLDIVDLVVVLEKAFQFKIREEDSIREIRTLGDIHRFVINKKNEINNL
ncbi:MAG: acyl carrier protein [Deltaproteobacteria bacterium]|jgi:acyl carrier protein|nr:acyl carrier protein [Deltaproteobacteria bacterium]